MKKLFQKLWPFSGKHSHKIEIRPDHDWHILFFGLFISFVLVVGVHSYLYYQINAGNIFTVNDEGVVVVGSIDKSSLVQTIDFYEAKRERFEALKAGAPTTTDPSL